LVFTRKFFDQKKSIIASLSSSIEKEQAVSQEYLQLPPDPLHRIKMRRPGRLANKMNTTLIRGTSNTTSYMTASIIPDKVDPAAANMPLEPIEKPPKRPRIYTIAKHHKKLHES